MSTRLYPYFEVVLWGGRLATPPQVRGTVVAKLFERCSIGGSKVVHRQRFEYTLDGRSQLLNWVHYHRGERFDIELIISPQQSRRRIPEQLVHLPDFVHAGITDARIVPDHDGPGL
jgi:hypothetical protein